MVEGLVEEVVLTVEQELIGEFPDEQHGRRDPEEERQHLIELLMQDPVEEPKDLDTHLGAPSLLETVVEVVAWTGLAGASGLVGGAASEVVKAALGRARPGRGRVDARDEALPLALVGLRQLHPEYFSQGSSSDGLPEPHAVERLPDGGWLLQMRAEDSTAYEVRVRLRPSK